MIFIIWHLMLMILFRLVSLFSLLGVLALINYSSSLNAINPTCSFFVLFVVIVGKLIGHLSYKCTLSRLSVKISFFTQKKLSGSCEFVAMTKWILRKQFESKLIILHSKIEIKRMWSVLNSIDRMFLTILSQCITIYKLTLESFG